jgi:predicted permease
LTGFIFGSIPALAASRPDIIATLKDKAGVGGAGERLRGALVIVQVALSLILLICCGLFIRSLRNAGAIDPGFDADNLLMASMDLELQNYQEAGRKNFSIQLLNRVRALPGVEAASMTDRLPLGATRSRATITIEGYAMRQGEIAEVFMSSVTPGYFETLRIPIRRGRSFNEQDQAGAPGVAIVNETFARRYWPGQEPIGKRLQLGYSPTSVNESPYLEVVGVAKDGKYVSLGEEPQPFFYLNLRQRDQSSPTLIVRTRGNPIDYLPAVRNEALALDKNLPLYDVKTMKQHLGLSLLPAQLAGGVLGVFGLMALVLAASGIYGVIAYSVAQRTREIGIRMAMGASTGAVLRLVVKYGLALTLIGMTFGLVASLALTRLMKTMLIGVSATDPLTFIVIALLFIAVAMLACYIPARRAAKVDPMIALRCE